MKILFTIIAVFFSSSTFAGWTSWGKVTEVMSHGGKHFIYTTITNETCSQTGNFWWYTQENENPDADDMFSIALSALMADREIAVHYDPNNQECQFNHIAKATLIRIR